MTRRLQTAASTRPRDPEPPDAGVDAAYPVGDLIGYLRGRWAIERTLLDRRTGNHGGFHGELVCTPDGSRRLRMRESGELEWAGAHRPAWRSTYLEVGESLAVGYVTFEDGRMFHRLDLETGETTAYHPCGADAYTGRFRVHGPDRWTFAWEVTGPAKDLVFRSVLNRVWSNG